MRDATAGHVFTVASVGTEEGGSGLVLQCSCTPGYLARTSCEPGVNEDMFLADLNAAAAGHASRQP
jgi:hypothetical protein